MDISYFKRKCYYSNVNWCMAVFDETVKFRFIFWGTVYLLKYDFIWNESILMYVLDFILSTKWWMIAQVLKNKTVMFSKKNDKMQFIIIYLLPNRQFKNLVFYVINLYFINCNIFGKR